MTSAILKSIQARPLLLGKLLADLSGESDRGLVQVAASALEDLLSSGTGKNSNTFSQNIELAYSLQKISNEEYHDLTIIRSVRNTFSHEWVDVSLHSQENSTLLKKLRMVSESIREAGSNPRECLACAATLLIINLVARGFKSDA